MGGSHCIMDSGKYGSFGWCFTAKDKSYWGSCSDTCPLFGPAKVLAKEIKRLDKQLEDLRTFTNESLEQVAELAAQKALETWSSIKAVEETETFTGPGAQPPPPPSGVGTSASIAAHGAVA